MSDDRLRDLSHIGGIGFTLVAYVLVFTGIGYGLDRLLGSEPWLMVAGVFVGAGLGFYAMIRALIVSNEARKGGGDRKGPDL
jgi:F0F1-type ATP synthase assembly protein I